MAVNDRTLRTLATLRVQLAESVDAITQSTVTSWGIAWNELIPEWVAAIDALIDAGQDGKWPTRAQVARAKRAQQALEITSDALDDLARQSQLRILSAVPGLTERAALLHADLIASQYPIQPDQAVALSADFDRVDARQLRAIVERVSGQVTATTRPLSAQATAAMRSALVRGIAVGDNPTRAAADMLARVHGEFDGGRNRALVIARTEMLDAHRSAGRAQDKANADVLQGWQWVATLDRRTCPSCWSKHGTVYDLDDPGPQDHQQGRCTGCPVTKSLRDLGFDLDDPPSLLPDAEQTFHGLPREEQTAIMGSKRLALLDSGKASWSDLSTKRSTSGWRDSFVPTPVAALA